MEGYGTDKRLTSYGKSTGRSNSSYGVGSYTFVNPGVLIGGLSDH